MLVAAHECLRKFQPSRILKNFSYDETKSRFLGAEAPREMRRGRGHDYGKSRFSTSGAKALIDNRAL